jgi:hypothetical protein
MTSTHKWRYLSGLPGGGEIFTFHQEDEFFVREGLVVEFELQDTSWIGNFAPGLGGDTAVYLRGEYAFVIATGTGYMVNVRYPAQYELLRPRIVVASRLIEELNTLILVGAVNVCAYSTRALLWCTPQLSSDGVQLQTCSASGITGVAERVDGGEAHYFTIDPKTGRSSIGARYP